MIQTWGKVGKGQRFMRRSLDCTRSAVMLPPNANANWWRGVSAYSDAVVVLSMSMPRAYAPVPHILGSPSTTLGTQFRQMGNDAYRGA